MMEKNVLNIAIISIYPPPKYSDKISGVASYTKNLTECFPQNCNIYILANKYRNTRETFKKKNNTCVIYHWTRNFTFPINIVKELLKRKQAIDVIHVQHEFFIYGSKFSIIFFVIMLFLLKIMLNKPIVVTLHHGFLKSKQINKKTLKDFGIKISPIVASIGFKLFFNLVYLLSSTIIVHEKLFKEILERYGIKNKVVVISHGVNRGLDKVDPNIAKNILNINKNKKVILYFGYLSKFKGVDLLIDTFNNLKNRDEYILIIAGGEHPRLKDNKEYMKFIQNLKKKASSISKNIIFTGFVPDEKIPIYFSAADVVVLPYKVVFASSGPLSLATSYEKPFLLSKAFKDITDLEECIFENEEDLVKKIEKLFYDREYHNKLDEYSKKLKNKRNWNKVAKMHLDVYRSLVKR